MSNKNHDIFPILPLAFFGNKCVYNRDINAIYSVYYSYEVHRIFYLLPLASSLFPAPCSELAPRGLRPQSLLPNTQNFVPHDYDKCYIRNLDF
ncbi:hypothetical protein [Moorena sp. SIO4A5]|uniref:hypothetical protein n=1 Tax=Moorena sp. SIO4A5 TaxID=2607838 RepID=UPI0013CA978E|nr:hypothetical protein [Moorena sp. SIO4A5]NEO21295.1 hypothetical protein [Moorena sp. SIO4A5]NEQ60414.1 hypothetical protein [Moorena sp. SIO4A1]